jgi:hypothetical protein
MFSTDFLLMTTVHGLSTLAAALMIEYGPWELREVLQIFAIGQILSGLIWVAMVSPGERRDATLKQVQAIS